MPYVSPPLNAYEAMVNPDRTPSKTFLDWVTATLLQPLQTSSQRVTTPVSLTTQAASISTTPIPSQTLAAGIYRVSVFAAITQAATVSSSLTVTITFTHNGLSKSLSGVALTGNTTTTVQSNTFLIHIDGSSPVSYATTYASAGATPMQYALDVILERVAA